MGNVFFFPWEVDLIEWFQQNSGTVGNVFMKVFSFIGGETVFLLVMLVILFLAVAVYPRVFPAFEKIGKRK